jgi:hypothetical protein
MNSLNVFIHFSEEIVSKLYQSIYWTDTIFKLKTRIKSIQKILTAVKMLAICIKNYFVEKVEALVVFFSVYGFL